MNVTALVCTYNRCGPLRQALESIAVSQMPPDVEWEILVVDNNSSDRTKEVVAELAAAHPGRVRYLFEPTQGKSAALNTGLGAARGEIIAFTDDDVTVAPDWLARLTANLRSGEWAGAAGRVIAVWTSPKPDWVGEGPGWDGVFPSFDPGLPEGNLPLPPFGANMAYLRQDILALGGFRTDVGPIAGRLMFGVEDTELGLRALASGRRLRYEPGAVVYHPVPAGRARKAFALRWFFGKGRGDALTAPQPGGILAAGVPLNLLRRVVACSVRCVLSPEVGRRFNWAANVAASAGSIVGHWEAAHRRTGQCKRPQTVPPPRRAPEKPTAETQHSRGPHPRRRRRSGKDHA